MPAVGSSSTTVRDPPTKAMATESFRFMPPERFLAKHVRLSSRPTSVSHLKHQQEYPQQARECKWFPAKMPWSLQWHTIDASKNFYRGLVTSQTALGRVELGGASKITYSSVAWSLIAINVIVAKSINTRCQIIYQQQHGFSDVPLIPVKSNTMEKTNRRTHSSEMRHCGIFKQGARRTNHISVHDEKVKKNETCQWIRRHTTLDLCWSPPGWVLWSEHRKSCAPQQSTWLHKKKQKKTEKTHIKLRPKTTTSS